MQTPPHIDAEINYQGEMSGRPRFYANDHSRDELALESRRVSILDARDTRDDISFEEQGFQLLDHISSVNNFRSEDEVANIYLPEIEKIMYELTGADKVVMGQRGVLRFSKRSEECGTLDNSQVAGFVHVDCTENAIPMLMGLTLESAGYREPPGNRFISFNAWRVISPPPQDAPLTVCDMRTVAESDLVRADAVFDSREMPEWSFESYLVHFNPDHRWHYFSNMTTDEVLIFKTFDSEKQPLNCVPHVAFEDSSCPPGTHPRASIEVRGYLFFE